MDSDRFTKAQIRRLNYFRLFLQAVTLSDLTDASDERLDQSKLHGVFNVKSSTNKWLQFNQDRPSEEEWKLWRNANLLWSNRDGTLHTSLKDCLYPRAQQRQQHLHISDTADFTFE